VTSPETTSYVSQRCFTQSSGAKPPIRHRCQRIGATSATPTSVTPKEESAACQERRQTEFHECDDEDDRGFALKIQPGW